MSPRCLCGLIQTILIVKQISNLLVTEMAKHDFGIMQAEPKKGQRYDNYNPEEYNCISVDDDDILPLLEKLRGVKCFWHTLDRPGFGLAYYGITLIPPESFSAIIEMIWHNPNLSDLMDLLLEAENTKKYVIHFGG